ncbi:LysR substrate-binding domain-containing protein [Sneathiella marina]|uniref:LysR substrate-binding domain-containing protein n=1 Tax=Sneathiella marina TaxID=2950108 RepID=A0ABY4W9W8_9PROT|nr:LysR family transcriptional regulator [Sneathiella marina]USG62560.1 LysR substrate-binding domain-containing protein [Sneathiella marina]
MAIKIEMLRCFTIVARAGNLADAADKLGRTQSAVSMMLKQLEAHLDGALFETDRKSKLTSLGVFVLEEASREIDHFDTTVTAIQNFARSQSGLVRIAAVPSVAAEILPLAIRKFLTDHPKVQVDIRDMDSVAVIRELEREQVDIGLATAIEPGSNISSRKLFTDTFGVVCPEDHPLAYSSKPIDWEEIEEWPLIANGICQQISDIRFQKFLAQSSLTVRNTTSLIAMVRSGVGITILPRLAVANIDQLAFVHVNDPAAHRQMDILSNTHTSLSPAAKSFEEAIYTTAQELALVS